MSAIYRNTPPTPTSPWILPGDYKVTLVVNGKTYTQPLTVKIDPRVKASAADLQEQFQISQKLSTIRVNLEPIGRDFESLTEQLTKLKEQTLPSPAADKVNALAERLKAFRPPNARSETELSFYALDALKTLFDTIQNVDAAPTAAVKSAAAEIEGRAKSATAEWQKIIAEDIPPLNKELEAAGLKPISFSGR